MYFFFFNDTATTEIYTLSLHDALPIFHRDREGDARDLSEPRRALHVHHESRLEHDGRRTSRARVHQRARPADATRGGDVAGSRWRQPRHGERERRWERALGIGSLRRGSVRLRHRDGTDDAPYKGGSRAARAVCVAT